MFFRCFLKNTVKTPDLWDLHASFLQRRSGEMFSITEIDHICKGVHADVRVACGTDEIGVLVIQRNEVEAVDDCLLRLAVEREGVGEIFSSGKLRHQSGEGFAFKSKQLGLRIECMQDIVAAACIGADGIECNTVVTGRNALAEFGGRDRFDADVVAEQILPLLTEGKQRIGISDFA